MFLVLRLLNFLKILVNSNETNLLFALRKEITMKKFDALFSGITEEAKAEAKVRIAEKQERKNASLFHCRIPDWRGQGGMVEFWINNDGTYEADDANDSKIRDGIAAMLK
jgi:hypothetical protein